VKKNSAKIVTLAEPQLQLSELIDLAKTGERRPVGLHAREHSERESIEVIRALTDIELEDWA
jgi:hypothetical protein